MVSRYLTGSLKQCSPARAHAMAGKKASQSRIRHAVRVQEVGAREDQREPQPVEAAVAYAKQNLKVVP